MFPDGLDTRIGEDEKDRRTATIFYGQSVAEWPERRKDMESTGENNGAARSEKSCNWSDGSLFDWNGSFGI
jgi:hypothetical protein